MATYRVSVRFVPVGSSDRTVRAEVDESWARTRLTEINAIYAPTDIEFELGAVAPTIFDDKLNLDVPPGQGFELEKARQDHAVKFHRDLVVFVRRYLKKDERDTRYKSYHYASVQADFMVAEPGSEPTALAHEFGHFFGLPHTFDDGLVDTLAHMPYKDRVGFVTKILADGIARRDVSTNNAMTLLDGDRGMIGDTPPDVGPPIFQPTDTAGEEIDPSRPTIALSVVVRQNGTSTTPIPYLLEPDKLNVMSYFTFDQRPHLSGDQIAAVRDILVVGKRERLIGGRWTNWVRRDGGVLRGAPSTIDRQPGLVELFGRGLNDRTCQNTFIDGKWIGWFSHNDGVRLGATPNVGSMTPDHLLLVGIRPDGTVIAKWWLDESGQWTTWEPVGAAQLKGSPSIICRQKGLVELFGRGLDDRTWQTSFVDGEWLGWFSHEDGVPLGSAPTVGSMSPDHLLLVATRPDGTVIAKYWLDESGQWTSWEPLGAAQLKGSPSIVCRRPEMVELFGRGLDDRTWQTTYIDGEWLGWFSHQDKFPIGATPTVGSMSPDHLQLFVTDPAGVVWQKWWTD